MADVKTMRECCPEKVKELIANAGDGKLFTEKDEDGFLDMTEEQFGHVMTALSVKTEGKKAPAGNKAEDVDDPDPKKPATAKEFIANAPAEIASILTESLAMRENKKKTLIAALTSNKKCPFTEVQLNEKDLPELEKLVALAGIGNEDYSGQFGTFSKTTVDNERKEDGTGVPTPLSLAANFGKKKEA